MSQDIDEKQIIQPASQPMTQREVKLDKLFTEALEALAHIRDVRIQNAATGFPVDFKADDPATYMEQYADMKIGQLVDASRKN